MNQTEEIICRCCNKPFEVEKWQEEAYCPECKPFVTKVERIIEDYLAEQHNM